MSDFWIGFTGLVVAICSVILTVALRLYDYRKQGSQRRIDRIGDALRKLQPILKLAKASYQGEKTNVPLVCSQVQQVSRAFREEIMYKGLEVDLVKASPDIDEKLKKLYSRFTNMETDHLRKLQDAPNKQNVLLDEFRDNVANDDEIKELIEELVRLVDEWLAKHP